MRNINKLGLMAGSALLAVVPPAPAQSPDLQKTLQDQYALTKLSDDRQTVITAGAILTLKVDGLIMVPMSASADPNGNTFKDGDTKITQGAAGKGNDVAKKVGSIWNKVPLVPKAPVATNVDTRKFVAGEKLNATKIVVNPDRSVAFELASYQAYTDANIYYRATLTFRVAKGAPPPPDDKIVSTVAEVFSVAPAETTDTKAQTGAGASQAGAPQGTAPNPAPATPPTAPTQPQYSDIPPPATPVQTSQYADIPPPPPPPAAPRRIATGMTFDEVKAIYGEPDNIIELGPKVIYKYKIWKITFVKGKVSDAE